MPRIIETTTATADSKTSHTFLAGDTIVGQFTSLSISRFDGLVALELDQSETIDAAASTETNYALTSGRSIQGSLATAVDHDWYRVQLVAGQPYTFSLDGAGVPAVSDTYLRLRDSTGGLVDYNDDGGSGSNSLIKFTPKASGIYYLDAASFGDRYAGDYTLSMTGLAEPPTQEPQPPFEPLPARRLVEVADAAASTATTYNLDIGKTAQGQLGFAGDRDWYRVNLVAGKTYTFAMIGTSNNAVRAPYLRLLDGAGTQIGVDNDSGPGNASAITFTATTSGTYYLGAGANNDTGSGQYGISATQGPKANYDEEMAVGSLLRQGLSWSAAGTPALVSWAVRASDANAEDASGNPTAFIPLSAAQTAAVQKAFQNYSDVANIRLQQVNPGGASNNATILVGAYSSNADGSGAYTYLPGSTATNNVAGDIHLNDQYVSTNQLNDGSYSSSAILHEMGHAIGLAHPGDYNAAPGQDIIYANDAQFLQDDQQYSVMSYFDESSTTGSFNSYADTLLLYDILAVQRLYGANMNTRSGDTVYGFGSNAGASAYDFSVNRDPVLSIWDGGGNDTLDASGFNQNQVLDLHDGSFSDIGGFRGNVSIAFGATIENAIGGRGADTLTGNGGNNRLTGGSGRDVFSFKDPLSSNNIDMITDFSVADDTIRLDPAVFAALAQGGPLSSDAFRAGSASLDSSDRILYDGATGALAYDRDGAGGYASVRFATLSSGLNLTAGNFQVA